MSLLENYDIKPIGNFIVFKREAENVVSEGGIHLDCAPSVAGDSNFAAVLACGPGLLNNDGTRQEMQIKVGDRVLLDKFCGQPLELNDEVVLVARESEVIAVIRKK